MIPRLETMPNISLHGDGNRLQEVEFMKKALILDDENNVLKALRRLLLRNGWQVISFSSPLKALSHIREGNFPVVITDYQMPYMNGVEFLVEFQKSQPYAYKIMLSGQAGEQGMTDAINQAKIDFFIHKPWNNKKLLSEVEQGLTHYRNRLKKRLLANSENMNKETYLAWYEKQIEHANPGITKVRKNALGWIEIDE